MKPSPNKTRAFFFLILWLTAVVGNLVISVLDYIVWSRGMIGQDLYNQLVGNGWGHYAVAGAAAALAAIVVPAAYLTSLDRRRRGRPVVRLYFLWFSLAASLAGYLLGSAQVGVDNYPVLVGAALAVLVTPMGPIWLERVLGLGKIRAAEAVFRSGHAFAALPLVRLGLLFQPSDATGERVYGLILVRRGREAQAMPFLKDVYERGDRSPDLLIALAAAEEAEGDPLRAAQLIEELQAVQPTREGMDRLIRLWLATGQNDRVLKALEELSREERAPWIETLQALLAERHDIAGLRKLAAELERDGQPFVRSRACYDRMLSMAPEDGELLEEAANLAERSGDQAGALILLERLAQIENPPRPEVLRRLVGFYDAQERTAEAMRRRAELVSGGEATGGEKLTVLDDLFSRGEYAKVIALATSDEDLRTNARAASTLAFAFHESGRADAALEQATVARELNPPAELLGELASMEVSIRSHRLSGELAELASRVEEAPDDLELRFRYLDRLAASKAMDRVVVLLEELLSRRPDAKSQVAEATERMIESYGPSGRLTAYLADLRLRDEDWEAAFELASRVANASLHSGDVLHSWTQKILRRNPGHAPSLLAEAAHAASKSNYAEALIRLDDYLRAGGERTADVMRLEMDVAAAAGELERADRAGQDLLSLNPADHELRMRLAEIASDRKDYKSALERLRVVAEAEPDRAGLPLLVRRTEERNKEARIEAIRQQLVAEDLDNPDLREEMGDLFHDLGRLNEALVEYQRAAHFAPERHIARAKLGYVLARKGLYSDAEDALGRTDLRPDQPPAELARLKALFFTTAEVMEDDHEPVRAMSMFKRVFNVDAGYRDVMDRIEHLQKMGEKKRPRR